MAVLIQWVSLLMVTSHTTAALKISTLSFATSLSMLSLKVETSIVMIKDVLKFMERAQYLPKVCLSVIPQLKH